MSPESRKKLRELLYQEEGYRQYPYFDTRGNETIGIGRNLKANGISLSEAYHLLDNDIDYFSERLETTLAAFKKLDETRKIVLVDMCFNLGLKGLLGFKKMLAAVQRQDWDTAAKEILASNAALQTGKRYQKLSQMMKTGGIPQTA